MLPILTENTHHLDLLMTSSSIYNNKRSREPSPGREVKRAQCPSDDGSQLLSYEAFKCLGNPAQKEYVDGMLEVLSYWDSFKKSCPRIDMMVHEHYNSDNRLSSDEEEASHALQQNLNLKWKLLKKPASRHTPSKMNERTRWSDDELRWNSDKSRFELKQGDHFRYIPDAEIRQYGLHNHISSSLLWYRLTIFIGEPHIVTTDGYKSSWDMTFRHTDGISSFRLWDSKGAARAVFHGLTESENDALEFANFLTVFKFPHTYESVIAGTVA